jgi:hypothetical protein
VTCNVDVDGGVIHAGLARLRDGVEVGEQRAMGFAPHEFVTDLRVEEFSFGAGYVAVGRARSRGRAQAGSPSTAWPAIAPVTDRLAAIST